MELAGASAAKGHNARSSGLATIMRLLDRYIARRVFRGYALIMVILASVKANIWLGFAAATIMILGAAYTLWMYKRVWFGAVANANVAALTDVSRREFWLLSWPDGGQALRF